MVYENSTFSYNQFGQRLGKYDAEQKREQKYYCTFYTEDRVIVSLEGEKTLLLYADMREDRVMNENRTDLFFEDPAFKHAEFDAGHVLRYHFLPFMNPYFQLIQGMDTLLMECQLEGKYHAEFFLELYSIFKIRGFKHWTSKLVDRIMKRVKKELISDLYHFPMQSEFETINDIIWDELSQLPISLAVQQLNDL